MTIFKKTYPRKGEGAGPIGAYLRLCAMTAKTSTVFL